MGPLLQGVSLIDGLGQRNRYDPFLISLPFSFVVVLVGSGFKIPQRALGSTTSAMVSGSAPDRASIEVPLPEIGRKDLVHIHVGTAQRDTRVGRADDHSLIKHRPGLALTARPRLRLPCPPVSCTWLSAQLRRLGSPTHTPVNAHRCRCGPRPVPS